MEPAPWRLHRALAVLAEEWPRLATDGPPSCATLDGWLERSGSRWRITPTRDAKPDYEAAVISGTIPTRERSWHDVFNVLSFIAFPSTKHALHQRYWELQRLRRDPSGRLGNRSREEDALAVLDEASLILAGSPEAIAAVERARELGTTRDVDAAVRSHGVVLRVLGHALLEHLVLSRPPIGAGVVTVVLDEPPTPSAIDRALAQRIAAGGFLAPCVSPTLPWPDPLVDGWIS